MDNEQQGRLQAAEEILKEIEAGDIPEAAEAALEIRASVFAMEFEASMSRIMRLQAPAA